MTEEGCPKCKGTGQFCWEECYVCDGGRLAGPWRLCEMCNATGYVDRVDYRDQCESCDGTCYVSECQGVTP